MSSHTFHPDTHEAGLADGCPRCEEHAENPMASLDAENIQELQHRLQMGLPARSVNEGRAMNVLADYIQHQRQGVQA